MQRKKFTNKMQRHTQELKKWFLFSAEHGLQDHIMYARLDEASKTGLVEIQDWLIELGIRAENPTQDLLMLCVGDCLHKQDNQCTT